MDLNTKWGFARLSFSIGVTTLVAGLLFFDTGHIYKLPDEYHPETYVYQTALHVDVAGVSSTSSYVQASMHTTYNWSVLEH